MPTGVYTRRLIPAVDRFWPKVLTSPNCWEWQGSRSKTGYGNFKFDSSCDKAHRAAWQLACGPIPKGFDVLHACDNPACVRNDDPGVYFIRGIYRPRFGHLWLGTPTDNNADKIAKGRAAHQTGNLRPPSGEQHYLSRLTWEAVREIHALRRSGVPRREVAKRFGVAPQTITNVMAGRKWPLHDCPPRLGQ